MGSFSRLSLIRHRAFYNPLNSQLYFQIKHEKRAGEFIRITNLGTWKKQMSHFFMNILFDYVIHQNEKLLFFPVPLYLFTILLLLNIKSVPI